MADYPARRVRGLAEVAAEEGKGIWTAPCDGTPLGAFVAAVTTQLAASTGLNVTCFPCESACPGSLIEAYAAGSRTVLGAAVFDAVAPAVSYRLRLDSAKYAPGVGANTSSAYQPDGSPAAPDATPQLFTAAVVPLQLAVDAAVTTVVAGAAPPPPAITSLWTKQFPSLAYTVDMQGATLVAIIPIYMTLIFTLQVGVGGVHASRRGAGSNYLFTR